MKKNLISKILSVPVVFLTLVIAFSIAISCSNQGTAKEKPKYNFKSGGPSGAMLSIDGQNYDNEQLMGSEKLEFAELEKKLYDLRLERVHQLLLSKAYSKEAKEANMSTDEYIDKKVLSGDPKISDKEYKQFVEERKIPKEQLPQLKEKIYAYLKVMKRQEERKALVTKLSKKHKVDIYFGKPDIKVEIDTGSSPVFGDKKAKVTIVEFSDFQCPYCMQAANTVSELKKHYGNKIFFAFKNFPLPMHPQAKPAAEASMCVHEQGSEKYWKYHDKLFANQNSLDTASLTKFAKEVGAKEAEFKACLDAKKYSKQIDEELEYGNRIGVRSTPTFFVNGQLISGAMPFENFKEIIDEELGG